MLRKTKTIELYGQKYTIKELTPVHVGKFLEKADKFEKLTETGKELNLPLLKDLIFEVAPDCIEGISKEELLNCGLSTIELFIEPFKEVNKSFLRLFGEYQQTLSPAKADGNPTEKKS